MSCEQPEPDRRRRCGQQLVELGRDPLPGEVRHELGVVGERAERRRLDGELEGRGEPNRPDHPEGILPEPRRRVADGPEDPGVDIGQPVVRVDERGGLAGSRAPGHRVHREVAAGEVELDRVAELDPVRPPEVGVVVVAPERRDLEDARRRDAPPTVPNRFS